MPNYLKLLALLYVILSLVIAVFFSGCSGPIIAEIAEGHIQVRSATPVKFC